MVAVNVKRFSRAKTDSAPPPATTMAIIVTPQNTFASAVADSDDDEAARTDNEGGDGDDDLFADLTRTGFETTQRRADEAAEFSAAEKERKKQEAKDEREMVKRLEKAAATAAKRKPAATKKSVFAATYDDGSVFADTGSEILGRDKRKLITKISQYKQLFPTELKTFKVRKNSSESEMRAYLDEMQCIVETSSLDEFITDSIIGCLKMVEGVTAYTQNFNISGLADLLKANRPRFHSLCKQLYIKYQTFDQVPPEQQLILLVATTSYVCLQKNRNKSKIEALLNESVSTPLPGEKVLA
jgi:hypothetical protein